MENNNNNDYEGHRQRLRNRFFEVGLDGFEPHEVLELLLFNVYVRRDTKKIAKKVLEYFKNDLHKVLNASDDDLKSAGLSDSAASLIKLSREIFVYQLKKDLIKQDKISSSNDAGNFLKAYFKGFDKEEFCVIYLNNRNKILDIKSEFKGTFNESRVYVRELVKHCLKYNAASIIISHNHPSGHMQPSSQDIKITEKIKLALELFDIRLLDHILVGNNEIYSFAENGHL